MLDWYIKEYSLSFYAKNGLAEWLGAIFLSKEKMTIEERLEVIANGCKS